MGYWLDINVVGCSDGSSFVKIGLVNLFEGEYIYMYIYVKFIKSV